MGYASALAGLLLLLSRSADAHDCNAIKDGSARLACFDQSAHRELAAKMKIDAASPITSDMRDIRGKIDKALLDAGISMEVSISSKRTTSIGVLSPPIPSLVFFGALNRASVYQIVNALIPAFEDPRKAGFKTVEFVSLGAQQHYIFDIRKPSNVCSIDLCF